MRSRCRFGLGILVPRDGVVQLSRIDEPIHRLTREVESSFRIFHRLMSSQDLRIVPSHLGEIGIETDDGGTKADVGAHREESTEGPEGGGRGEEEERDGEQGSSGGESRQESMSCVCCSRLGQSRVGRLSGREWNARSSARFPMEMTVSACNATLAL